MIICINRNYPLLKWYESVDVKKLGLFMTLLVSLIMLSCQNDAKSRKSLLIYCGTTMIKPVTEIAQIIEKQENCIVDIIKGGSGNLFKTMMKSGVGDLYLPGISSYIDKAVENGLVTKTVPVGYNQAVLMARKGNPRNISGDLKNLLNKDYYVVIGNPASGSIGMESSRMLKRIGIYDSVIKNAREMTTDSKRLIAVIKENRADLVINWHATATWPENEPFVETIPIEGGHATPKRVVFGLLKSAKHPELAVKLMEYAASDKGRSIFAKYGLAEIK